MISFEGMEIYVATQPVDMRYGIERLGGIVRSSFEFEPRTKALFVFISRNRMRMKVLTWDGTGMVLFFKKLDSGRFVRPKSTASTPTKASLSEGEFMALLHGLIPTERTIH